MIASPPDQIPSLTDYPQCDREVIELAAELWGNCDGKTVTRNRHGTGVIIWAALVRDFAQCRSRAGFSDADASSGLAIALIHRRVGATDIYFVANANLRPVQVDCQFRVAGKFRKSGILTTATASNPRCGKPCMTPPSFR